MLPLQEDPKEQDGLQVSHHLQAQPEGQRHCAVLRQDCAQQLKRETCLRCQFITSVLRRLLEFKNLLLKNFFLVGKLVREYLNCGKGHVLVKIFTAYLLES